MLERKVVMDPTLLRLKITRMRQDSLRGTSKILLVSCLVIMTGFEFKFSFLIVGQ